MSKINQELITKARKGEIAILNDGSVEELKIVLTAVWPKDGTTKHINSCSHKYFVNHDLVSDHWFGVISPEVRAHSVKDFFMDQPESKESFKKYLESTTDQELKSRTYRVTRQQMKDIWEAAPNEKSRNEIRKDAEKMFSSVFAEETDITSGDITSMIGHFNEPYPEAFKKTWPEYFFIPEGEPVLVRKTDSETWRIYISDGNGGVYADSYITGNSCTWKQIIPFTKNPPK